uniref:Uncharacterized protein n=1 Tax=Candidatus Kentrum sp. UNK TaxID=2126344 RepID=A0A451ASR7_9GAMM|nr:MAG: hypothetical protein BECKUNK1418G_GA0071005_13102 [Candidatus Kentron sp. UNK]VFK73811.1 MAG: hypothetical protein BECKUNK1418H_GA0071006_13003 [Candidatus Kentron sp. UNK]
MLILKRVISRKVAHGMYTFFTVLTELGTIAASVASQIDDTRLAVGGKAMQEATQVYNYVKTAAKTARRASNP